MKPGRLPFLLAAVLSLLAGLAAGMARMGWPAGPHAAAWAPLHGPLMSSAFLGTLIALERAVAVGRPAAFGAPALAALGALFLLAGAPTMAGWLMASGAVALLGVYGLTLARRFELPQLVMAAGALAWLGGDLLWLAGRPMPQAALWWLGFLVLTIAGERLELGRIVHRGWWMQPLFLLLVLLLVTALAATATGWPPAPRLCGLAIIGLALWLGRFDVARRTIRLPGQPRYMAACMLAGYLWLALAGLLLTAGGLETSGPRYDAAIHAIALGFVFSMIFAHALVILPAVTGVLVPFSRLLYLPLALLHLSLVLRLTADLFPGLPAAAWPVGGVASAAAILLFFLILAGSALRARAPAAA